MTDEEVIETLEKREGNRIFGLKRRGLWYRPQAQGYTQKFEEAWRLLYEEAKQHEHLKDDEPVTVERLPAKPYLESRDALASVLDRLDYAEKHQLSARLLRAFHELPEYSSEVYATWILTLPPRDLAHAIAEAIVGDS